MLRKENSQRGGREGRINMGTRKKKMTTKSRSTRTNAHDESVAHARGSGGKLV